MNNTKPPRLFGVTYFTESGKWDYAIGVVVGWLGARLYDVLFK